MRTECIQAVQTAAKSLFGKEVSGIKLAEIEGDIVKERRQLAREDIDAYRKMTPEEQLEKAAERVAQNLLHKVLEKKRRAEMQVAKDVSFWNYIESLKAQGHSTLKAIRLSIFTDDAGGYSAESAGKAFGADFKARMAEVMRLPNADSLLKLFADQKMIDDFNREAYGEKTGNEMAAKAYKAYRIAHEEIRKEANAAGFDIPKLEDYKVPQNLDVMKVGNINIFSLDNIKGFSKDYAKKKWLADRNNFIEKTLPRLKRDMYVEPNGELMGDARLREFLGESFDNVMLGGAEKPNVGGSIAGRHKQSRELFYKDYESYKAQMEDFGTTNTIDTILNSAERMGMEIAFVKKVGPAGIEHLRNHIEEARLKDKAEGRFDPKEYNKTNALVDYYYGSADKVQSYAVHKFFRDTKNWMVTTFLGGLPLAMIADGAPITSVARSINLPMFEFAKNQVKLIASSDMRDSVLDFAIATDAEATGLARFADSVGGHNAAGQLATVTMKVTGAQAMNFIDRSAFELAHSNQIGRHATKYEKLADVPEGDRAIYEQFGVTEKDWAIWRKAGTSEFYGNETFLNTKRFNGIKREDVLPIIKDEVDSLHQSRQDLITKLEERNDQVREWVANRGSKLSDYKAKLEGMLDRYRNTKDTNLAKMKDEGLDYGAKLALRIEKAEVDAEIGTMLANSELAFKRGEQLGARRKWLESEIKRVDKAYESASRKADRDTAKKAVELEKRFDERMKEFDSFSDEMTSQIEKREKVIADYESKFGDEVNKLANEAIRDSQIKFLTIINQTSHLAIMAPTMKTALPFKVKNKGAVGSELWSLFLQFKQFPYTYLQRHLIDRWENSPSPIAGRIHLLAMQSVFGAISLWASDIANGRDPRKAFSDQKTFMKFGLEAFLKGGGAGPMADIVFGVDFMGRDPLTKIAGPAIGVGVNFLQAGQAAVKYALGQVGGEEFKGSVSKEFIQAFRSSIPFQNLWYTKQAVNNLFMNDLHELASPGYKERLKGLAEKHYQSGYWIDPETKEIRAIKFGNIF